VVRRKGPVGDWTGKKKGGEMCPIGLGPSSTSRTLLCRYLLVVIKRSSARPPGQFCHFGRHCMVVLWHGRGLGVQRKSYTGSS
jgi:hypothetical protein